MECVTSFLCNADANTSCYLFWHPILQCPHLHTPGAHQAMMPNILKVLELFCIALHSDGRLLIHGVCTCIRGPCVRMIHLSLCLYTRAPMCGRTSGLVHVCGVCSTPDDGVSQRRTVLSCWLALASLSSQSKAKSSYPSFMSQQGPTKITLLLVCERKHTLLQ